jgi:hypothetical protein
MEWPPSEACSALFFLNREMAIEFFLSPTVFSPNSRIIDDVLKTFVEAKTQVPREKLLELIAALEAGDLEHLDCTLAKALHLLGRHQRPEDRSLLEPWLNHTNYWIVSGASEGLFCLYGLVVGI